MTNPCIDCNKIADAFMRGLKPKMIAAICAACPFASAGEDLGDESEPGEESEEDE